MTWHALTVAPCATHHLRQGDPAYSERFEEVLAFHAPGLAPVRSGPLAWHVHPDGAPAYARRFTRTFGFYEGLATVIDDTGWHHVRPDGQDDYPERFAWCGNFQGGRCTVRDEDSRYFHLLPGGGRAYAASWRYAGDYRDAIAVVQGDDGRSTHIDRDGAFVHGAWFLDLDVFHKGFARARDERGWMHIDRTGRAAYDRRFSAVEPFYNGQARVERFDGGLEVIDEKGRELVELRPPLRSDFAALSGDLVGFWRTQTIAAAVEFGVFEVLPASTESVAAGCGLDVERAGRLLRALAELRLVERAGGTWAATARGVYLLRSHAWTLADAALEYAGRFTRMWSDLPEALRAGSNWRPPDVFGDVAKEPEGRVTHHRMLQSYARHDYATVPAALALRGDEHVVDAGGGLGELARGVLAAWPGVRVTLLDRPEVVAQVAPDADGRLDVRPFDLFETWPVDACDVVLLARVLHDWDDDRAGRILSMARDAMRATGRLYVVEMVVPDDAVAGALCDLHLLMATGGRERREAAYRALFSTAGFDLVEVRRLSALPSILVGVPR